MEQTDLRTCRTPAPDPEPFLTGLRIFPRELDRLRDKREWL
jgi:hypothetical protein